MSAEAFTEPQLGDIVPKAYNAGYVALSYLISLVGAASTLELINRRSWFNGIWNQSSSLVLGCSAFTMGGIAIWSMHFIGNQALILSHGETEMEVEYSAGITVLSFCMAVIFLLAAFYAIGISNRVALWRVITAGTLCGSGICGMHYLANASIKNYSCTYNPVCIAGAAIISVVASTVALAMFFILQSVSGDSWWKRTISAFVLAGAVSSMHWCAAVGTEYRLVQIKKAETRSRTATNIAVTCFSLGACIIIAGSAILRTRALKQAALRAQQIELGAIVFDKKGRLLVDSTGVYPSTVVTDFFVGENTLERFDSSHSQFHWVFQASRNWIGISGLINGMKRHLAQLPHKNHHKDPRKGIKLITDDGKLIDGHEIIFRELFCVAASELSNRLNEPLTSIGVLWDEILPKRPPSNQAYLQALIKYRECEVGEAGGKVSSESNRMEKGLGVDKGTDARGALMFLVRRLTTNEEADRLASSGYRFVSPGQVSRNLRSHQQIQSAEFTSKLLEMRNFVNQPIRTKSGIHLCLFSVQDTGLNKPQVLVQKEARQFLPSRLGGLPVNQVLQRLRSTGASVWSPNEELFAKYLCNAIEALNAGVQEPLFNQAVLSPSILRLPFGINGDQAGETVMIALRLKITYPVISSSPNCQWIPLNFFKVRQMLEQSQQDFLRVLHSDFDRLTLLPSRAGRQFKYCPIAALRRFIIAASSKDSDGKNTENSTSRARATVGSSSTVNLCPPESNGDSKQRQLSMDTVDIYPHPERHYTSHQQSFLNGGIVVFQEVTVHVEAKKPEPRNDLALSWSQDTVIGAPETQQDHQKMIPLQQGIKLQPNGWGKNDVCIESNCPDTLIENDRITTMASFMDTLVIESSSCI
ncbi:hypothetical protein FGRMN_6867 [Fusarium graminum]|nr:hypothetical protein FGRMN_6867 [Fusarium graminum]